VIVQRCSFFAPAATCEQAFNAFRLSRTRSLAAVRLRQPPGLPDCIKEAPAFHRWALMTVPAAVMSTDPGRRRGRNSVNSMPATRPTPPAPPNPPILVPTQPGRSSHTRGGRHPLEHAEGSIYTVSQYPSHLISYDQLGPPGGLGASNARQGSTRRGMGSSRRPGCRGSRRRRGFERIGASVSRRRGFEDGLGDSVIAAAFQTAKCL
jgi:hypothetical protein